MHNPPNRRIRTRTYGGVGGAEPQGSPLSRLFSPPSTRIARGGEGSGVGGSAAFTEAAVPAERPPSPPLRGGRGEDGERLFASLPHSE